MHKRGQPSAQHHRPLLVALAVAAAARLLPVLYGLEHYGDAPVRIEIAQRWSLAPHLWRGFTETFQYGPLHLTLLGALIRLLGDRVVAARALSLGTGLACVWLLYVLAKRERNAESAQWAALGLALSPLHIQASTTGASEAVFLALLLATLLLQERVVPAALLLGAAGLVRYDGWMYVPLVAALIWFRQRSFTRAALFAFIASVPAALWMLLNWKYTGDPLRAIHHIDADHRNLASMALAHFGQVRWRLYGIAYWPIAVLGIATPVLGALAIFGSARAIRRLERGWELAALAWTPAVYFTLRTSLLADFRPMARFALVAATLSLCFVPPLLSRAWKAAALGVLIATPIFFAAASWRRNGGLAEWARPLSPISSLPPGIADAAQYLREHLKADDVILLDGTWFYLDIPLAFRVDLPESRWIRAAWENEFERRLREATPTVAVLIYQGKLGDWTKDRFDFRGLQFCKEARFTYATIYRRCNQPL